MIIEELAKKYEDYRLVLGKVFRMGDPILRSHKPIERVGNSPVSNLMEDFLENYNAEDFNSFKKMVFLPRKERPNIDGYIVFAENSGSNFCYVYNHKEEGRIFCVNIDDGDYVWEAARSYHSFFRLLIEFLDMEMERIQHPDAELSEERYYDYYNRCMSIVEWEEDLNPFVRFMCCILE